VSEQLDLIPNEPLPRAFAVVPLADIQPDDELYGDPPSPAFVANIKAQGVLHPVGLVECSSGPYMYRVLYGRKRIKAQRQLGRDHVPAMIFPPHTTYEQVMTVSENAQRAANPVTDVEAIDNLLRRGATVEQMAEAFGLTVPQVRARMRLLRLIGPLRAALRDCKMLSSAATEAARLPEADQQRLADLLATQDTIRVKDVREMRRVRRDEAMTALPGALFDEDEPLHEVVHQPAPVDSYPPNGTLEEWRDLYWDRQEMVNEVYDALREIGAFTGLDTLTARLEFVKRRHEEAKTALAALTDALAMIDALEPAITPEAQRLLMDAHFHLSTAVAPYQPELQAGAKEKIA